MENQEQFDRLVHAARTSASFVKRKDSLTALVAFDHPRVIEVLQQASTEDGNPQVRKLAAELLATKTGAPAQPPSSTAPAAERNAAAIVRRAAQGTKAAERLWQCSFCGMENTGGTTCAYCNATRPASTPDVFEFERPEIETTPVPGRDVFLLNLGNRAYASGQSRRLASTGYGCILLILIPMLAIGLFILVFSIAEFYTWQQLNTEGVTTRGKFVDRRISTDSDDDRTYYATFQFEANRQTYVVEQDVDSSTYNSAEVGAVIDVLYLPSDPQQARVLGTDTTPDSLFIVLFSVCWSGILGLVVLAALRARGVEQALQREGKVISGEVVKAAGRSGNKGAYIVSLDYRFRAPDTSETISSKATNTRNDLRGQSLPAPGTPVAIAFRDRKTYKVL